MHDLNLQEEDVADADERRLRERDAHEREKAPDQHLARLGIAKIRLRAIRDARFDDDEYEQRPDEDGERGVERRHGRAEVLGRKHRDALDAHRCGKCLGHALRIGTEHRLQRSRIPGDECLGNARRQTTERVGRCAQVPRHRADLRDGIAQYALGGVRRRRNAAFRFLHAADGLGCIGIQTLCRGDKAVKVRLEVLVVVLSRGLDIGLRAGGELVDALHDLGVEELREPGAVNQGT